MKDFTLFFNDKLEFDIHLAGASIVSGLDLRTAVLLSIFSDRRAMPDDKTPGSSRGGWWADSMDGYKWGSRHWLLERAKQTNDTLNRDRAFIQECLKWLVEDGVASKVEVANEWVPRRMGVEHVEISIYKPEGALEMIKFDYAWKEITNAVQ